MTKNIWSTTAAHRAEQAAHAAFVARRAQGPVDVAAEVRRLGYDPDQPFTDFVVMHAG